MKRFLCTLAAIACLVVAFAATPDPGGFFSFRARTVYPDGRQNELGVQKVRFNTDGTIDHKFLADHAWGTHKYRYSHKSNGRDVYNFLAWDIVYNRYSEDRNCTLTISGDRRVINIRRTLPYASSWNDGSVTVLNMIEDNELDQPFIE